MRTTKKNILSLILLITLVFISKFILKDVNADEFERANVVRVIDGDTIVTDKNEKIRIIGINSPELNKEIYSKEAYDFALNKLQDRIVYLENDKELEDRYGRKLKYVWLEVPNKINEKSMENNFSYMIVKEGFARCYTFKPNTKYVKFLKAAEKDAIKSKRGMWIEDINDLTRGNKIEVEK